MLRLPDGMRDRIAEAANANNRSMNSEIVARLEASFSATESAGVKLVADALLERLREEGYEIGRKGRDQ